jgi:hypothetical protein
MNVPVYSKTLAADNQNDITRTITPGRQHRFAPNTTIRSPDTVPIRRTGHARNAATALGRSGFAAGSGELSSLIPFHLPKNVSLENLTDAPRAHTARDRMTTTASKDALLPQLLAPP